MHKVVNEYAPVHSGAGGGVAGEGSRGWLQHYLRYPEETKAEGFRGGWEEGMKTGHFLPLNCKHIRMSTKCF